MRRFVAVAALSLLASSLLIVSPSTAGAGGFCADEAFTDGRGTAVDMKDYCMFPTILRVEPGTEVEFRNVDGTTHMLGGVQNIFGNLHDEVMPKQSVSYTFKDEGVFPYLCILHPGMAGAIVVGDGEGKVNYTSVTGSSTSSTMNEPPAEDAAAPASRQPETRPTSSETTGNILQIVGIFAAVIGGLWWTRRRPQPEA